MNAMATTNQRLVTILLVLLIMLVALLIFGTIGGFLLGGRTMMGVNGQTMNDMISACSGMMQNFQNP
jgi:membrane-anchored glycerophosphoryl diester phosphodiesterase (GDPDase)